MPSEMKDGSIATATSDVAQKVAKSFGSRSAKSRLHGPDSRSPDIRLSPLSIVSVLRQPRVSRALDRLRTAVAAMPREQRLTTLQCLSGRVRALLLAHMEGYAQHITSDHSQVIISPHRAPASSCVVDNDASISRKSSNHTMPLKRKNGEAEGVVQRQSGITRVGKDRWRAHVFFLNIRSITACVSSRARALLFQTVLSQMKRAVLDNGEKSAASGICNVKDFLSSAERTLADACAEHGLTVDELGLAYRAEVPAGQMLSRDVWGRYTLELQKAFAERDALLAGKAAGWPSLRAAWIAVLQEPLLLRRGSVPNWTRTRVATCARRAAAIVDAAWEAGASRRERALCKKMDKERRQLGKAATRRVQKSCYDPRNRHSSHAEDSRCDRQQRRIASASHTVERAVVLLLKCSKCRRTSPSLASSWKH